MIVLPCSLLVRLAVEREESYVQSSSEARPGVLHVWLGTEVGENVIRVRLKHQLWHPRYFQPQFGTLWLAVLSLRHSLSLHR